MKGMKHYAFPDAASALRGSAAALLVICTAAWGVTVETPLASYEPSETDLTVSINNAADAGLTVSRVPGGVNGAPPATDGDYVLKVDFVGEDGKVEFTHDWASTTYDLNSEDHLLADVYIATSSAVPGLMGIWSPNWSPPDEWQPAAGIPTTTGVWTTVSFDVASRTQTGLDQIWAFIFENLAGATGTAYVDNLRLSRTVTSPTPDGPLAAAREDRVELIWKAVSTNGFQGYYVYRGDSAAGPFAKLNTNPVPEPSYIDKTGAGYSTLYYRVTTVASGIESDPSGVVAATYDGATDAELLDFVQSNTFEYFWNFGHPVSGLIREGLYHGYDICATGGTGMGLMAIVVGADRGFVTRSEAAARVLQMLTFLDEDATRYHGAWSHWINGTTGATIPFGPKDDGADLVETSYLAQGLLTVRQYFDGANATETAVRSLATSLWEGIEWSWFRRYTDSDILYWHWSPNYAWDMNLPITGYNETMITYILAIASPTYPMPPTSYYNGWARQSSYVNGNDYYGIHQWVGPVLGGPLFFTHYSFLGLDPRFKQDAYCNYFENSRNISLIHQAYCADNPHDFAGYSPWVWGLTASANPWGYDAQSPTNDNGTVAPTAALSAMPYVPHESLVTLRHWLDTYGASIWGGYGFHDAFNLQENWVSDTYLAIDQGPIVVMIENYRSGLCWKLFMANPEIKAALHSIGWTFDGDMNADGNIDLADYDAVATCMAGPDVAAPPGGCSAADFANADLDDDGDVDLSDAAVFQQVFDAP